jgi:hypothetical protein
MAKNSSNPASNAGELEPTVRAVNISAVRFCREGTSELTPESPLYGLVPRAAREEALKKREEALKKG